MDCAVAYYRTSSQTNVDGDSVPRQRAACAAHATRAGLTIRQEFTDAAVKGRTGSTPGPASRLCWHGARSMTAASSSWRMPAASPGI
ncbi:recombinase family protein [Paeniroseomonas aquatica]|uniref:recombinase family protein n=1 Tax=Paeniroseomonas aquatica TaxID=373043 RepID=UPI0036177927